MIIKINNLFTKIILFSGILSMASCLKDDAVDNKEIGVTGTEGPEWVSIPKASVPKTINVLALESKNEVQNVSLFEVAYDYVNPAKEDITVTLAVDNSLVTTADPTAQILPTSVYTIPSLTVKIPAGERLSGSFILSINTGTLDPTLVYGIGLKMVSVNPSSARIASNLNSIVFEFTVKNKWDGLYQLKGVHNRGADGTAPNYTFPFTTNVEMRTTGTSSVAMYYLAGPGYGQPIGIAPGVVNWYGSAVSPNFTFDPVTNNITAIAGMPNNAVTLGLVTNDQTADQNPDGPITNRGELGPPKKIYVVYQYNGNNYRRFYDTLTYIRPR